MADRPIPPHLEYAWMLTGPSWCTEPTFSEFIETLAMAKPSKDGISKDLRTLILDNPSGTGYEKLWELAPTDAARKEMEGMYCVWEEVWHRG